MKKETAEKAQQLLDDLSRMEEIRDAMKKEETHWWAFLSPDTNRFDVRGLTFPDPFRNEFSISVENTIANMEKELKEL